MSDPIYWRMTSFGSGLPEIPKTHSCEPGDEAGPDGVTVTHIFDGDVWVPVDKDEDV